MNKKSETRAGKYGRFLGIFINSYIHHTFSQYQQSIYKSTLVNELKIYSFEPRKRGEPKTSGCIWELENLQNFIPQNPEYLARLIKEGIHLMYQKQTQKKVLTSLLNELELKSTELSQP